MAVMVIRSAHAQQKSAKPHSEANDLKVQTNTTQPLYDQLVTLDAACSYADDIQGQQLTPTNRQYKVIGL